MQLSLFPETRRDRLDVPPVIARALEAGAVVAASISGGKDSQAFTNKLSELDLSNFVFALHKDVDMPTYAKDTSVTSEKSRAEIERTLARYGAESFMYGWDQSKAMIAFDMNGRRLKFVLPMPDRDEFKYTPSKRQRRGPAAAEKAYEQAVRQRWRGFGIGY